MEENVIWFRNLALAVTCVIFAAGFSAASNIYFAQNGAGGNTGADCTDAIALSSVTWTVGNTYHVCGKITSQIAPGVSGSSGSPITIIFEANAQISQGSCGSTGCINLGGLSYITVDGGSNGLIQATNTGTGLSSATSYGIYARSGVSHLEIKNLTIANMYVHNGGSDNNGGDSYGIWMDGTNNLIHNNTIHDAMSGIKVEASSSSNQYYSNTIYNCNWGIFESAANSVNSIHGEQIYNNTFHDWANWDTTSDAFHHDGVFLSGNSATTDLQNVQVYNNYFYGTSSDSTTCAGNPANGSCMTAYIYINTDSNVTVYNNLLVANTGDTGPNNAWILMYVDANDSLYNNTIIGGTSTAGATGGACVELNSGTGFSFKNNVLSNCVMLLWLNGTVTFASSGLDYNTYQNNPLTGAWRSGSNYYNTIADWRTNSGGDTNGQATTGSLGLSGSYVPQAGSIVIGAATNLRSLGITALDSDKASVARPGGTAPWDAGAYQDNGSNPPPNPPTGLNVQVH